MKGTFSARVFVSFTLTAGVGLSSMPVSAATDIATEPLYTSRTVTPLNMLVMGRDHKLYYEAYNDASDLDGDGVVDIRFKPSITYFGYFDSATCYDWDSSAEIFVPKSRPADALRRCIVASGGEWSGNFLNYVATSRIDALRKVLYGGYRRVDRADNNTVQTVLERSYTPQDGHSWGKEYKSLAVDGYSITDYTPLAQPASNARHLFASVNLNTDTTKPLIRVLTNSTRRIWEWVSKEAPVAGDTCINPAGNCVVSAGVDGTRPATASEFTALINKFSDQVIYGPVSRTKIDKRVSGAETLPGTGASQLGQQDNYISVLNGRLVVAQAGNYQFAINGDDAVDFTIEGVGSFGWYNGHGAQDTTDSNSVISNWSNKSPVIPLAVGEYSVVFRHEEGAGGDSYQLAWKRPSQNWQVVPESVGSGAGLKNVQLTVFGRTIPASVMTDYVARVQVCKVGLLEDNCTRYVRRVSGVDRESFKPEGILQQYGGGATPKMLFGLLTGSHVNNTRGGVIRREVSNISDEIDSTTGQFVSTVNGVIGSINKLKIVGYNGSYSGCGLLARAIGNNECHMWGNPISEMMYEAVRYFAGRGGPTSSFTYSSSTHDSALGLAQPTATWTNPYSKPGVQSCSVPVQTVISDINPSYDTDDLPGSYWNPSFTTDLTGLNVGALGDAIWQYEIGGDKNIFIGETNGDATSGPTAKIAKTFKNTRGLSPEEPTKRGGYYAASVAYHGLTTDLNARSGQQRMSTYAIALASPLPEFKIPVGGNTVTLVPFAKSVKYGGDAAWNTYAPTNTIVDFYVESIAADARSGVFRVNFEDVEQGNDHDMDAIARYSYQVDANNKLTISMSSDYAAGGVVQHMGYVISGTTTDGVFLEVRDVDTAEADDYLHPLDTPPGRLPGQQRTTTKLPLQATREFTASSTPAATLLKDPLWYAAKWGGFNDKNANARPDLKEEWTSSLALNPNPDNYFLVTNALKLRDQLDKAFSEILRSLSSSSAAAASTGQFVEGKSQVVQARFRTSNWSGELVGYEILSNSQIGNIVWNSSERVPAFGDRNIRTLNTILGGGMSFTWSNLSPDQQSNLLVGPVANSVAQERLDYLRGNSTREQRFGGPFRDRVNGVIGDITNSDPVYVDNLESRLAYVPTSDRTDYATFRDGLANRPEMVYAGTNAGLLHGVCALNCGTGTPVGTELLAYVPSTIIPGMYELTLPSYRHKYYVDGPSAVSDAKIGSAWKTVLLGALGAGGKGLYALDVTNPKAFGNSSVLWEFEPKTEAADLGVGMSATDMGYTIGKPQIARVKAGNKSVAIFSNGYNGASGRASLLVVDLATGRLIKRMRVSGLGQSLAAPALLDRDNDGYVDYVYAGDDAGKLWRFNLTASDISGWDVDLSGRPLLETEGGQPITSAPALYTTADNKLMVYVGTGRYMGVTDKQDSTVQAMYAVQDKYLDGTPFSSSTTLSDLVEQTIIYEVDNAPLVGGTSAGFAIRVTSANEVDYATKMGWFIRLKPPAPAGGLGERVNASAVVRHGRLIFTTLIPPVDTCEFGGSGWLMEMDAVSGKRFNDSVLDLNEDGQIDERDMYKLSNDEKYSIGGRKFDELIRPPAFVGFGDKEGKYISGSSGGLTKVWEKGGATLVRGRLSWQQLE
ncbi:MULTISPECIES: PilC/PilY family type IV pilus protein [unclassified Pseudomonas]|uniref:pilus assembly protein n=1 Tax=unclassified Pseudomonas TaxID=196821 RepID=UPI002448B31D|nr:MULTISPECIES: PilC/PilY family type IV pilus protein [unclassified Pseudomonas]MDG9922192.1 PilC/PilY family type IV pilus protein [Pseudomonas sp. GD04045]MDH0033715.1 PilC/PilY family type IV pilus protein [Pseudomonas sp. GD04019]